MPLYGWLGLLALLVAEALLAAGFGPIRRYMTPIAWTAYIAFADGAVRARTGTSLITGRTPEFMLMLPWSVLTWLVFEAYNLHLANWEYSGLPAGPVRNLTYAWAFSTIMPAVIETADLIKSFLRRPMRVPPLVPGTRSLTAMITGGALMLLVPAIVPAAVASYLFGAVWLGFIFLLEPVNYLLGGRSILGDLAEGKADRLVSLLLAGFVTGALWEFWNFWAEGRWEYKVPYPLDAGPHYFEMPWLGFVGFIPFMLELFAMFSTLTLLLNRLLPGLVGQVGHDDILRTT